MSLTFQLVEFNPRRHARGAEGASVAVFEDGEQIELLWMRPRDIRRNMRLYGQDEGLRAALKAYETPTRRFPPEEGG